jgi:hypothetical protein
MSWVAGADCLDYCSSSVDKALVQMRNLSLTTKKAALFNSTAFRGSERIRTAVDGFADRCLATRPRNH